MFFSSSPMWRSAFILAFRIGILPSFLSSEARAFVGKGAGHDHIESGVGGLPGGSNQVLPRHRAELRTDEDSGTPLALAFGVAALGGDVLAGPRGEGGELDPVLAVGLLDAGGAEVFEDDRGEIAVLAGAVGRRGVQQPARSVRPARPPQGSDGERDFPR